MKTRTFLTIILIFCMPFSANCQKSRNREKKKLVIIGVVKNVDKTPIANAQIYVDSVRNLDALNPLDNVFRTLITYKLIITQN